MARRRGVRLSAGECRALLARDGDLLLAAPQTYMNRSGYAARCLVERHRLSPRDLLVVYDEVALPLGRVRLRAHGSSAGHRGIESVLHNLQTDAVARLRLGIAPPEGFPPGEDLVDYVLSLFAAAERAAVEEMVGRSADACECWAAEGVEAAMNRFNR